MGGDARKPWEGGGDLGQGKDGLIEGFAVKQAPWGHLGFSATGSARNAGSMGNIFSGLPTEVEGAGVLTLHSHP